MLSEQIWNRPPSFVIIHPDSHEFSRSCMSHKNMFDREKELALSTLVRRKKNDPGAVELLVELMFDPSEIIRKRAVAIADRFIEQQRTGRALLRVATTRNEVSSIRQRSMQQLEILFEPHRGPDRGDLAGGFLSTLQNRVLNLMRNSNESLEIRGHALELAAWFVHDHLLREWILYFHNQQGNFCKMSAIAAMGRTGEPRWRTFIQGYLDTDNMEFTCAALEAMAEWEGQETINHSGKQSSPEDSSLIQ